MRGRKGEGRECFILALYFLPLPALVPLPYEATIKRLASNYKYTTGVFSVHTANKPAAYMHIFHCTCAVHIHCHLTN